VFDKAYLWIFGLLMAAGMGFPIPEEVPIVTAGVWVGHAGEAPPPHADVARAAASFSATPNAALPQVALAVINTPVPVSNLRWWIMLPVCIVSVVLSDSILYSVGRLCGPRLLDTKWMRKLIPPPSRERIEGNFNRYGIWVLMAARFTPAIRSPIFIMAGVMRISLIRFVIADGIYAIPGVSALFFLAYWFGDQFREWLERAEGRVHSARPIIIMVLILAVAAYMVYHFLRYPVATGDPREEIPVIGQKVAEKIVPPEERAKGTEPGAWSADGTPTDNAAAPHAQDAAPPNPK
jgi:membrane protein DedA with SNARE-associated domain